MCCSLPPEMLDLIVDHLHDQPATLRVCCLVSKSWVPRTRTHLFAHVRLTSRFPFGSWAKAFPDPLNSPAHHTRSLTIQDYHSTWFAAAAGVDAGHWIRAFHNVVHLDINRHPFAPLHGLSPTVKSLRLALSRPRLSEVFDLMCSFPLLEDFSFLFYNYEDDLEGWTAPSTSPRLTGSFKLRSLLGIGPIPRRLLDLPNGLNFTRAILACDKETDFKLVTDLVEGCSNTLESLSIVNSVSNPPTATSFNLSTAVKLKRLVFLCMVPGVQWVTDTLQTVESRDLQEITLQPFEERDPQQWRDLDRLLVRFWTSHSIRPKVAYRIGMGKYMRNYVPSVLPELTRRGLVDLVQRSH